MTYFQLHNHHGERIGETNYLKFAAARTVALRTVAMWRKRPDKRGSMIRIVEIDPMATWGAEKVVERIET